MQLKVEVALLHALQAVEVFLADGNALFGGSGAGGVATKAWLLNFERESLAKFGK